jgi:RimJ/RimL family protein N-acetyltransferase
MDLTRMRQTARLRLEPMTARHAVDLWRVLTDPSVAEWYGAWTPAMAEHEAARIEAAWQIDGVHKWMAFDRVTGELIGRGGLSWVQIDGARRLEIGWALRRPYWGRGYATEIGREGLTVAFDELAVAEVISYTETRNTRSRAVMERLGFHYRKDLLFETGGEPFALYTLIRPDYAGAPKDARRGRAGRPRSQ